MAAFLGEEAMSALVEAGLAQQLKKGLVKSARAHAYS